METVGILAVVGVVGYLIYKVVVKFDLIEYIKGKDKQE